MVTNDSRGMFFHTSDIEFNFDHAALFWVTFAVSVILSLVAIVGNGVIIFIGSRIQKTGVLKNLNNTVRSLAITDFLIGLAGTPAVVVFSYWG